MLNASKNAKIVGVLLIVAGAYDFINGLVTLASFLNRGNTLILDDIPGLLFMNVGPVVTIIVGYGLFKSKLWGIYGVAVLIFVRIATLVWVSSEVAITVGNYVMIGIYIILFIWFYLGKKNFSK